MQIADKAPAWLALCLQHHILHCTDSPIKRLDHLCPKAFGWTMSHMISSSRKPGSSAIIGLNIAFRYEMLCTDMMKLLRDSIGFGRSFDMHAI